MSPAAPKEREATEAVLAGTALTVSVRGHELLRDVDVAVRPGAVVGVLGPSGAGKTTLFRTLVGEWVPSAGKVTLRGVDVTRLPLFRRARLGIGYVPQAPSVLMDLTVADNVRTFERAAGVRPTNPRDRAATVELEGRLDVRARDLSGGERRRLELLRGLLGDPVVLVCDEPFAASDPIHLALLSRLIRGHADRGNAVLLADHRLSEALSICDEALLLVDGRVAHVGPASAFAEHPAVKARYLG
ncbi:MAG TPA: ATP-binding cassette domain-containing protein [Polyangiaceae bacterium]|nr:ATP-binding cassette domain-containing protein [Polyangiaceae bacterium]